MKINTILIFLSLIFIACNRQAIPANTTMPLTTPKEDGIKMTTIDGGKMDLNLDYFSIDSSYTGQRKIIENPVFIIEHPKGKLIWDTGINDAMVQLSDEEKANLHPVLGLIYDIPVMDQLKTMGMTPADFDYVSFSHVHLDHAGNGNAFADCTWLVHQAELDFAFSDHPLVLENLPNYNKLKDSKKIVYTDSLDVFGDGKLIMYPFPGHTPGHACLLIDFDNRQDVMLTGDLYHFKEQRAFRRMPVFNADANKTLESMKAFEAKVESMNVEVIIQHDPEQYKKLPKYPAYWN